MRHLFSFIILCALGIEGAMAQSNTTIQHRRAYFYDKAEAAGETSTPMSANSMITVNGHEMQNTSTYTSDIYVLPQSDGWSGTSVSKSIDFYTRVNDADNYTTNSNATYQRVFNYKTDGLFTDGKVTISRNNNAAQNFTTYANGYVRGSLLGQSYVGNGMTVTITNMSESDEYQVALDASNFTDADRTSGNWSWSLNSWTYTINTEPTLVSRSVYTIRHAAVIAKKIAALASDKYLEEKEIMMPSVWLGINTSRDRSCVALDMMAQNYYVPSGSSYVANALTVSLDPGTSGITLATTSLSGTDRFVKINYPSGKKVVDKTTPATITVKSGNYRIAKFTISFVDDTEPLPWKEVLSDPTLKRSPLYMDTHYQKLAALDFDYSPKVNWTSPNGTESPETYPYPLPFENMSFGYFHNTCQWGQYVVQKHLNSWQEHSDFKDVTQLYIDYFGQNGTTVQKESYVNGKSGGYFLYADASEFPAQLGRLDLNTSLCTGMQLYCSAWVSAMESSGDGGNLMFTLVGIDDEGNETDISNFVTGTFRESGVVNGTTVSPSSYNSGTGVSTTYALWQQVAFATVIGKEYSGKFTQCALKVYNMCSSSSGGDFMIDNIAVYMEKPNPVVEQSTPVCGDTTLVKVSADYDNMLKILAMNEVKSASSSNLRTGELWYSFLDMKVYDATLAEQLSSSATATDAARTAFNAALLGNPAIDDRKEGAYHHMKFYNYYDKHTAYTYKEWMDTETLNDQYAYKETLADGTRHLVFNSKIDDTKLKPYGKYYIVVAPYLLSTDEAQNPKFSDFTSDAASEYSIGTACVMMSEFTVMPSKLVRYDGDLDTDGTGRTYCSGQTATLKVEMRGYGKTEDKQTIDTKCFFDWWIGDYEEYSHYQYKDAEGTGEDAKTYYIMDAMDAFRYFYPTAPSADLSYVVPKSDNVNKVYFTQEMKDAIIDLSTIKAALLQPKLQLYQPSVNVVLKLNEGETQADRKVVVIPIENSKMMDDTQLFCFEPEELVVHVEKSAPSTDDGYSKTEYPFDYGVGVRMGLEQLNDMKKADADRGLYIPIRKTSYSEDAQNATMITLYDNVNHVYVSATNDPNYAEYLGEDEEYMQMPIAGEAISMAATPRVSGESRDNFTDFVKIRFNDDFNPREGYFYTLKLGFRQVDLENVTLGACDGTMLIPLYIVPKHVVWTGEAGNSDWSNDKNWRRADVDELDYEGDYFANTDKYPTNEENGKSSAFVPMYFTDVLLQSGTEQFPSLYYLANNMTEDDVITTMNEETATENIQYDMAVEAYSSNQQQGLIASLKDIKDGDYFCRMFYSNRCDSINFAPSTQIGGARLLRYSWASVEYELAGDRWYTLTSPLKSVIAGDMYLPRTGRQTTPYFRTIEYDNTDYSRVRPAVYQKGWSKGKATVYHLDKDGNGSYAIPATKDATSTWDVAISADWSDEYNDVEVPYSTDNAFSIKIDDFKMTDKPEDNLYLLRLPKSDASFEYYTFDDTDSEKGTKTDVTSLRGNVGHFYTDNMGEDKTAKDLTMTSTNADASCNYFLVGNPFMTGLNMTKFFESNTDLEQKYWILSNGEYEPAVSDGNGSWTGVNATSTNYVAPLQSFFVKRKSGTGTSLNVTFKEEMSYLSDTPIQVLAKTRGVAETSSRLVIKAERDGLSSTALVVKDGNASDSFGDTEDAETLLDSNLQGTPTVYTTAGGRAASINKRSTVEGLSIGIASDDESDVELTFDGVDNFDYQLYLYDAKTNEATAIESGKPIVVAGSTAGRYYITGKSNGGIEDDATDGYDIYTSDKTLHISGLTGGETVVVSDAAGRVMYNASDVSSGEVGVQLQSGVYIVKVNNSAKKISIR